jgi:SAM-dependent methyltransferase
VIADITALPFEDESFELVLCSHVLEHVEADAAAMREMRRVLRPGGAALIQSPVNHDQERTFESPELTSPEQRARYFSQPDHVRVYGRDIVQRLERAGFEVAPYPADGGSDAVANERYGLVPVHGPLRNEIYVCRRRSEPGERGPDSSTGATRGGGSRLRSA